MVKTLLSYSKASIGFAILLLYVLAATGRAAAMGPGDCVKIQAPNDRLTCFDRLFKPEKPVADSKKDLRDITVDENERIDKSMRSICSDCLKK